MYVHECKLYLIALYLILLYDADSKMSKFNPLSKILDDNRLNGPNYVDWKRNLTIVLTAEKIVHVLTTDPPLLPEHDATIEQQKAFEKWHEADGLAKCYILASMTNILQKQHEGLATGKDMMFNAKEMFGEQSRSARQSAMKKIDVYQNGGQNSNSRTCMSSK